ncbi:hypothetical protein FNV43_RR21567 [Rhamnella rubrinervis]|uniref:Uncharacterized protein n=1 Tax=Rhamnella rubrinervis TaxID=2594499 RepID=A0A8K0E8N6_9ROSA|nr:hypothetical protein FNV43_RR21567 [Rhamnella rubrinervis]
MQCIPRLHFENPRQPGCSGSGPDRKWHNGGFRVADPASIGWQPIWGVHVGGDAAGVGVPDGGAVQGIGVVPSLALLRYRRIGSG